MRRRTVSRALSLTCGATVMAGLGAGGAVAAQTPTGDARALGARVYAERCASCHDAPDVSRSPSRANLGARAPREILAALEPGGVMAAHGQPLSAAEKEAVATFLSAMPAAEGTPVPPSGAAGPAAVASRDPSAGVCTPSLAAAAMPDPASMPMWNGWGNDPANTRFQPASRRRI